MVAATAVLPSAKRRKRISEVTTVVCGTGATKGQYMIKKDSVGALSPNLPCVMLAIF